MTRPTFRQLPDALACAAVAIAETLRTGGFQAWVVGGAVRDLALGLEPKDIDVATDALPGDVERLFEHTTAVGRAFGTIVVRQEISGVGAQSKLQSIGVEVTTFRTDGVYKDSRHPEEVTYGSSVEEDARRRDFTCNALYLDPLSREFQDPERGLDDLEGGRLRCVGEAQRRFSEDGLRLLRLVRFEASFDLEPVPETLAGARGARNSLDGVSSERVLMELRGIFACANPARALERMVDLELVELALPGYDELLSRGQTCAQRVRHCAEALRHLGGGLELELGLALLLEPDPHWELDEALARQRGGAAEGVLRGLRPSRSLRQAVVECWRDRLRLRGLLSQPSPSRCARLRLTRRSSWPLLLRASEAWSAAGVGSDLKPEALAALERERAQLGQQQLFPEPLLKAKDLERAQIERGPRWKELLEELESLQLDGQLSTREAALEWLARQD